jgi:hypothetical protein
LSRQAEAHVVSAKKRLAPRRHDPPDRPDGDSGAAGRAEHTLPLDRHQSLAPQFQGGFFVFLFSFSVLLEQQFQQFTLGVSSLSKLGPFGAALEIVLILYLIATSSIGLYTAPVMSRIRPRPKRTPFCLIIGNCAVVLILSSALPLLSKILGELGVVCCFGDSRLSRKLSVFHHIRIQSFMLIFDHRISPEGLSAEF